MHLTTMALNLSLLFLSLTTLAVQGQVKVVVPQGIESVNGSSVNMGCTSPLVDSDGVMICGECSTNLLTDGNSPAIDTSTSDWASQLVTVRKTPQTDEVVFDHVPLTFGFDTAVNLTGIELDLFLCPEWGISAIFISLYFDEESNLVFSGQSLNLPTQARTPSQSSCNSLSTVTISLGDGLSSTPYLTVHALISSFGHLIDWVHVGEVRFLGSSPQMICPTSTVTSTTGTSTIVDHTSVAVTTSSQSMAATMPSPSHTSSDPSMLSQEVSTTHLPSSTLTTPTDTTPTDSTPTDTTPTDSTPTDTTPTDSNPTDSTPTGSTHTDSTHTDTPPTDTLPIETSTMTTQSTHSSNTETSTLLTRESVTPTTPSATTGNSIPTMIILAAVIAGLVLLVLLLVAFIIFCVLRRRRCCRSTRASHTLKTLPYELEKLPSHQGNVEGHSISATNPIQSVANSRYACTDPSIADTDSGDGQYDVIRKEMNASSVSPVIQESFYDEVARERLSRVVGAGYECITLPVAPDKPSTVVDAGYELISLPVVPDQPPTAGYELIPLPGDTTRAPKTAPSIPQHPPNDAQPGSPAEMSGRSYSVVQIRRGPKIPEKSSDLVQYLETRVAFNENIYSESITPSDFMSSSNQPSDTEDVPGDPEIYAPIYPSPSVVPESPERPAEVTIDNMTEKRPLRTGQFGEVVLAATRGLSLKDLHLSRKEDDHDVSITVAIKKLKPNPTQTQREAFEREGKFLSRLRHPNVVRLLGVCYQDPAFIMMEYMREGDLSQFLQKYSEVVSMTTPSSETQIARSTLVYMASQIASGMKQLAAFNFVHRDLATRNCLVGKNFTVKVASLGVDKNVSQSHYFRIQGNTLLPIRWMAPECFNGIFSEKSDVWAFGVTMWELFTLAKKLPYPHLSDEEVIHNAPKVRYHQFPSQPPTCPDNVHAIMEQCWTIDMKERTTFKNLNTLLQNYS